MGLTNGPQGASVIQPHMVPHGMTAEPAQVMVYVPNTRALAAESSLSSLKWAIVFVLIVMSFCLYAYFYVRHRRKEAKYEGTTLPSVTIDLPPVAPVATTALVEAVKAPEPQFSEDVVSVTGPIPIWTVNEDDPVEARVDENSNTILDLIKKREQVTKDVEAAAKQH